MKDNLATRVEALVAQIPEGRVMTYGQLAALCGSPRAARIVGGIAHYGDIELPWHRVVNIKGGLASGYHGGRHAQKEHLEAEGVVVSGEEGSYFVDINTLLWWPDESTKYEARSTELESQSRTSYLVPRALFIVGPTASGKSGLAMDIARKHNGEIICADSQTIRKAMNIGTAKPTLSERSEIRHHMLDIVEPYERYNVSEYAKAANAAIADVIKRGKLPIIVGGSGLYIDALLYGFSFRPALDSVSRKELESKSVSELQGIVTAQGLSMPINNRNPRHLIRTIESGGVGSKKGELLGGALVIGLNPSMHVLEKRIRERIDIMFEQGLTEEVKEIVRNYGRPQRSFDAIGYKIVLRLLDGEILEEEARELFKVADRQYAKRQQAWFKRNSDIMWFEDAPKALEYIEKIVY